MIRTALAQLNLPVGDISGNSARIIETIEKAGAAGAQVVAFTELAVTGYPPEDLLHKRTFVTANREAVAAIAETTGDVLAIVGFVDEEERRLYNAAAICHQGRVLAVYRKQLLPNYGVFDERRYFEPGVGHVLVETDVGVIGVCVCEDAWSDRGPLVSQGDAGAQMVVNINASPFHKDKLEQRTAMLSARARRARASIVYVNTVGGQDELVFDGGSVVLGPNGEVVARLPQFEEGFALVDVPLGEARVTWQADVARVTAQLPAPSGETTSEVHGPLDDAEEVYKALLLSLRDYAHKNRFQRIALGLSGGIDSSLAAALAADAIGPENVLGVAMPSEFSSDHSIEDAKELAANLGIDFIDIGIREPYNSYLELLEQAFGPREMGLAEENLQARIRGNLVMAISNRYGHLVLATGNKSEMACGYATLYGDMAGGFAVLRDVFKLEVYALSRYRNSLSPVIPERVLTKAPSAELRHGQKDSDSLPPYDVLDPILDAYIEHDLGVAEITGLGYDHDTVAKVISLVDRAEYKRRQAPPGPKVTTKAFGRDRRLPITNAWREPRPDLPLRSAGPSD